jgi:very-short-patch-repair endonuclease
VNTWIAGFEVDFCFPTQRLIVETDSWRHHRTREAFERDRRAHPAGYRTLRCTHDQLTTRPGEVAQTLAAALS